MANAIVQAFRQKYPADQRSDDEITADYASAYQDELPKLRNQFPDFHADLLRLTQQSQPQPAEIQVEPYPPSPGQYFKQALSSGIRGATSTLASIPQAFGSAARIAGTYSVPGAEYVPMRFETEPGFIETALPHLGEAISPEPVPELQKSFLATTVPAAVGSGVGFLAGGAVAGAAEAGLVSRIGQRAMARALEGGLTREAAVAAGEAASTSAARRLSYGNIASLGALSQAQQGYEEAKKAGGDEHTRFLAFALNLPVGMTEAVPLANMLNRMDKLSGGTLKHALLDATVDTFEEALQNSFQGVAGDVIASKIAKYEPDRKLFSSLADDAASGGISAAILSLASSFIGAKMRGHRAEGAKETPKLESPAGAPSAIVPQITLPITPPAAAPEVAAQYATEEEKAAAHAQRMQDVAQRHVAGGGFGADDLRFISQLAPEDQVTYAAMVQQARAVQDAAAPAIETKVDQAQATEAAAASAPASPTTSDVATGTGGQPATAPEKEIVAPAPPPIAPVVFHSVLAVPGAPPVVYFTPTAELRAADGGLYRPGDAITPQNLAGFTLPQAELTKANEAFQQQLVQPEAVPIRTAIPTATVTEGGLPPALEVIAQKSAANAGLSKEEIGVLNGLMVNQRELHQRYLQRVTELRKAEIAPQPPAAAVPVAEPLPAPASPAVPVPPPAAAVVPRPSPLRTTATLPPSMSNVYVPPGYLAKARARATALITAAKRKVAKIVHASPILSTIDFDGDSPLTFELSGRGTGERTRLAPIDPSAAVVTSGQHEGQKGNIVRSTDTEAWIKLKNGTEVRVKNSEYRTLEAIRDEQLAEQAGGRGVARNIVAPAYFELRDTPAATDKALQAAGLVSQASATGKVDHGSRTSWTHRWTVFRRENRIYLLPTYKSEGKIMAAEAGQKKGTPVVALMKRGFVPVASFRAEKAVHAIEAAKPVMGADEYEKTLASHARERMAALARTHAAVAASMEVTPAGTEGEETILMQGREVALPGTEAPIAGQEPALQPVLPAEIVFSKEFAQDIFSGLTEALAKSPEGELSISEHATINQIAAYAMKGKYGKEIRDTALELSAELGEARASRAILTRIVGAYNNSTTSAEFAAALSRAGIEQPAAAAGGERGLPGAPGDRAKQRRSQPAAAVPAAAENIGVAGAVKGTGPTRSQPKFRIVEGGYTRPADVSAKVNAVLERLSVAGIDLEVFQQRTNEATEEFLSRGGGLTQGNAVTLVMSDIAKPTTEDLITAIHETGHVLFNRESPEMQRRLHEAIRKLSDAQLGLEGAADPRARMENIARLDPEQLAEERLVESLANEGFDPIAARSWSQRIIRYMKDVWNRACIVVQEALFGPGSVNPERALEYFRNRLRSFLAGDPMPLSFVDFLGGGKLSLARSARFYLPIAGTETFEPVVLDWESGTVAMPQDAAATVDAALANIRNAVRSSDAMYRRPGYVSEGEPVGGENPTVRGGWNFAAARKVQDTLRSGYDAFNATGANPADPAGVRPVSFDNFIGLFQGDLSHPQAIMDGVQAELAALSATPVNPDLSVDGLVTFENDATRKQAQAIALGHLQQWLANLNEVHRDETRRRDSIGRQLNRKIDQAEKFIGQYQNLTFHFEVAKEAISDLVKQTKDDIREGIALAKHVGMLTQALRELQANVDDPIPPQYEKLVDRMANRIFNDAEHFTEFLQGVAALDVNWQGQTLPQMKVQLRQLLETNPLFSGLDPDERNIALALSAAFARNNDHQMAWLEVRQSNDYEAVAAIREMLNEARKDTTANLNKARGLVARVPRLARQAQRILDNYVRVRKEARTLLDEQLRNTRILQAHAAAASLMSEQVRSLETSLGASRPIALVEGAQLPMVLSPTDTPEEIAKATPIEYHSTGDNAATPAQVGALIKRYETWVETNRATGGAMVETLKDLAHRLNMEDARKQAWGIRQNLLSRALGSLSDAAFQSGSVIAQRIGKRLTRYAFLEGSFTKNLSNLGIKVTADRARAMKALKVKDVNYFMETFHDGAFGYFEKRKDLQERPDAHEAALSAWKSQLLSNPTTRTLLTPAAWERLKAYYERAVEYNRAQVRDGKEITGGPLIKDDNLGLVRDPIGDPLFAMPRGLNSRIELLFHAMRDQWNGTRSPKIKAEEMAQAFRDDPAALQASLRARFGPEVWRLFVGEMANRDGRSLFSGRLWSPGKWTIAQVENVRRAYREAAGDALNFAARLHELEGNTPDTLPAFVGETLETFQNYFDAIEGIMSESESASNLFGLQKGVPRYLMDARVSEDFPTGWLRYQHFDQYHARQAIHRFAFHAAFGRNGSEVSADFHAAINELSNAANEWKEYLRRARTLNPTKGSAEVLKAARALATSESKNVSLLENAGQNEAVLRKTQDQLAAWFKSHSEDSVEPKVFLEVLSLLTGLMVQGPKTAMINTMDLFGGPVIQYGLTTSSLRQVRDNWGRFFGSAFGSLFQTVGIQINTNGEDQLLLKRLGHTDPDNQVRLMDRLVAAMNSEVPGGPVAGAFIRGGRVLRTVTQVGLPSRTGAEGLYPTVKAAPFSMISRWMNEALITANWGRFRGFVGRGVEYLRAHPAAVDDPDFRFTAQMMGYQKGTFLDEEHSFNALKEAMNRWGMSLENVAKAALRPGAPIFTDEQHRAIAEMALEELSLEASPNTAPRWSANPVGRFTMPLLRWSFARTNQLRKAFQEPDGQKNLHAFVSGLKALSLATGVGIAYALLMERYDEDLTGKKSNIRGFGQDNNFLAAIEMTARMGSLGLWGDVANTVGNYAGTGDLRGMSLDNRVVFVNSLLNSVAALTTWAKQGDATYSTVYRQLLQALGGSGYLQIAQILNHELSLDDAEARVTSRINVGNWLRAVGREMNLDVRIGRGAGAYAQANSIKPWIGEMVLAALADDQGDFVLAYSRAVEAARNEGKPDPVKHVQQSFAAYNPLRTVYVTPPTEAEYQQILARLPASGRADVQMAMLLFNKYGNEIGVKEYEGRPEKVKPPPLFAPSKILTGQQIRQNVTTNLFR